MVHERLRYAPLGWTKRYEFSDADTQCALDCIDQWVDRACPSKAAHINPEQLPWEALCTTLSQSLYGGRIANSFDQAALDSFIRSIFRVENYGHNAGVAFDVSPPGGEENAEKQLLVPLVTLPNGCGKEVFETWINSLPDKNSPTWLGLPPTAENQLQSVMGQHVLAGLAALRGAADEQSAASAPTSSHSEGGAKDRQLQTVLKACSSWLSALPCPVAAGGLSHSHADIVGANETPPSALERFLSREAARGDGILGRVRADLDAVQAYCQGAAKSTNRTRHLFACFLTGQLPGSWDSSFESTPGVSIGAWVGDLAERLAAIGCSNKHGTATPSFWLGGMFSPEAFVTATRQLASQANNWSLEELELTLEVGQEGCEGVADTIVRSVIVECAQWSEKEGLALSSTLRSRLPPSRLRWGRRASLEAKPEDGRRVTFPVYLNESRADLVAEVWVRVPVGESPAVWAQRGVAFVLQAPA